MYHRFFETDVIRPFLFIHGQEAVTKQISQVSDVYVNFYLQLDFDHIWISPQLRTPDVVITIFSVLGISSHWLSICLAQPFFHVVLEKIVKKT